MSSTISARRPVSFSSSTANGMSNVSICDLNAPPLSPGIVPYLLMVVLLERAALSAARIVTGDVQCGLALRFLRCSALRAFFDGLLRVDDVRRSMILNSFRAVVNLLESCTLLGRELPKAIRPFFFVQLVATPVREYAMRC